MAGRGQAWRGWARQGRARAVNSRTKAIFGLPFFFVLNKIQLLTTKEVSAH